MDTFLPAILVASSDCLLHQRARATLGGRLTLIFRRLARSLPLSSRQTTVSFWFAGLSICTRRLCSTGRADSPVQSGPRRASGYQVGRHLKRGSNTQTYRHKSLNARLRGGVSVSTISLHAFPLAASTSLHLRARNLSLLRSPTGVCLIPIHPPDISR